MMLTAALFVAAASPALADQPVNQDPVQWAREKQKVGEWGQACLFFEYALYQNPHQPEDVRKDYLLCFRQCLRRHRLSDPLYRTTLLNPDYTAADSWEFYRSVVEKVRFYYLETEKVRANRLFRQGLEELCLDLEDREFREAFLAKEPISQEEAEAVTRELRAEFGNREVGKADGEKTKEAIFQVYRRIVAKLNRVKLSNFSQNLRQIVYVEFACGACNDLDEYTYYLSPTLPIAPKAGPTVVASIVEKGIGKIKLTGFDDSTVRDLEDALAEFKTANIQALVLDLRDNSGGSFKVAVQVAEHFLPVHTPIVETSGKAREAFESTYMQPTNLPLVVLVNGDTASAAELLAGTLKSNGRAELIGQTTFGKSLIQKTFPVSQAPYGTVQVTFGRFVLPRSHDLSRDGGIAPTLPASDNQDIEVPEAALKRVRSLAMVMR
jgi:hypothetical protein